MKAQELLYKVGVQGLSKSSSDEVVKLACAFWHEDLVPDLAQLEKLDNKQLLIIGYLTEFFASFHCVTEHRVKILTGLAAKIKKITKPSPNSENPDDIAAEWGLQENLNPFLNDILFYQTRHYEHKN